MKTFKTLFMFALTILTVPAFTQEQRVVLDVSDMIKQIYSNSDNPLVTVVIKQGFAIRKAYSTSAQAAKTAWETVEWKHLDEARRIDSDILNIFFLLKNGEIIRLQTKEDKAFLDQIFAGAPTMTFADRFAAYESATIPGEILFSSEEVQQTAAQISGQALMDVMNRLNGKKAVVTGTSVSKGPHTQMHVRVLEAGEKIEAETAPKATTETATEEAPRVTPSGKLR